jgi:transposase
MKFYNHQHPFYCGIDLHARILYVCILDDQGKTLVHQKIGNDSSALLELLKPYLGNIVVGVECMHCWYWVSDFCEEHNIDFIIGHALYMKAIHGGKAKSDRIDSYKIAKLIRGGNFPLGFRYPKQLRATRDLLRRRNHLMRYTSQLKAHITNSKSQYNLSIPSGNLCTPKNRTLLRDAFPIPALQYSMDMDLNLITFHSNELKRIEKLIFKELKKHQLTNLHLIKSVIGIGDLLGSLILLEIGDLSRFPDVKHFASYARLVKCQAESAGKIYGTQGNKIGNAHLKWAFSEAAVIYLSHSDNAEAYLQKLQRRMSKAKSLSVLAHKLGRAVYFLLKNQQPFDEQRFLNA